MVSVITFAFISMLGIYKKNFGPLDHPMMENINTISSGSRVGSAGGKLMPQNGPPLKPEELSEKVVKFLNEESDMIDVRSMAESQACFKVMRDIYNIRMQEYVTELKSISEKLKKYDDYINMRKSTLRTSTISETSPVSAKNQPLPSGQGNNGSDRTSKESQMLSMAFHPGMPPNAVSFGKPVSSQRPQMQLNIVQQKEVRTNSNHGNDILDENHTGRFFNGTTQRAADNISRGPHIGPQEGMTMSGANIGRKNMGQQGYSTTKTPII